MATPKRRGNVRATPIVDAKTVAEFVIAANREFGLKVPERWPEVSAMAQVYALKVTVTANEGGEGYTATATSLFPTLGRSSTGLSGRTHATVTRNVDSSPRRAIGGARVNPETPRKPRKKRKD